MVEPLSAAAIAVGTIILTKTIEKPGEKLGEILTNQIGNLINLIKRKPLPKTQAIEKAEPSANFEQAVQELETAAAFDPELGQHLQEITALVNQNPALQEQVKQITIQVKNDPSLIVNHGKLADEIKYLFQGGTFNNPTFQ